MEIVDMPIFDNVITAMHPVLSGLKDVLGKLPVDTDIVLLVISVIIGWIIAKSKVSMLIIWILLSILIFLFLRLI